MGQDKSTIRFLIINSSSDDAEALLNVFREAGYATRGYQIGSQEDLEGALSERQKWDLLLIAEPPEGLSLTRIFDYINQQGVDLPSILLSGFNSEEPDDEPDTLALIKQGARSVIPVGNDDYLLTVALKELDDLKIRRQHRLMSVALHESEKQRRVLLDDQSDAVVYVSSGHIQYANPAFAELIGQDEKATLVGRAFTDLVTSTDQKDVDAFLTGIEESGQVLAVIQCPLTTNGGAEVPVKAVVSPTSFEGEFTLSLQVRTLQQQSERPLAQSALAESVPDKETGLFDKQQFEAELDIAIQRVISGKGKAALCCVSLENLKDSVEQNGRQVSQQLLKAVAQRLSGHLGIEHHVASWGSGHFMTLLKVDGEQGVQEVADGILESVAGEVSFDEHRFEARISLGAIVLNDTTNDAKTLLVQARHASAQALVQGGSKLCFYQKRKVSTVSSVEKHLAGMVSQAMKSNQMKLLYQPVVNLKGANEEYYEVSFSLTDPRGREHNSSSFRNRVEKTPLWNKVDRWKVIQASKALMAKRKEGRDTRLIMHLGGATINDDTFLPWMKVALKTANIPTRSLVIELSEPNLVRYAEEAPLFFKTLKEMGCQTAVRDFGCSLHPMEALEKLDVDLVKVDASFTRDLDEGGKAEELQKLIKQLAKKGRQVIVPGVESADVMAPLWQCGVDFIQGGYMQLPTDSMSFDFGSEM